MFKKKENMISTFNGMLFSLKNNNMDETGGHYAK